MTQVFPPIEPNITVGQYLDSLKAIHKKPTIIVTKVTYDTREFDTESTDDNVQDFWTEICRIHDLLPKVTDIEVKYIPSELRVTI